MPLFMQIILCLLHLNKILKMGEPAKITRIHVLCAGDFSHCSTGFSLATAWGPIHCEAAGHTALHPVGLQTGSAVPHPQPMGWFCRLRVDLSS